MGTPVFIILGLVGAFALGAVVLYVVVSIQRKKGTKQAKDILADAQVEAERLKKEALISAKD